MWSNFGVSVIHKYGQVRQGADGRVISVLGMRIKGDEGCVLRGLIGVEGESVPHDAQPFLLFQPAQC